ncbi:T-complex protein 11-like protein 1 isoform X2 [Clavelina lepadiformis]|uniref:T-complex protein 11-like protein 1 isoform X2 n=1 Tax=Clavelina lepadiformis TaxID=159417 RepID=UPI0040438918
MSEENSEKLPLCPNHNNETPVGKKRSRDVVKPIETKSKSKTTPTQIPPKPVLDICKASPPNKKSSSMKDLLEAKEAAHNLFLAHEIAVNDKFKISEPSEKMPQQQSKQSPIEKFETTLKTVMYRAFWDKLDKDLKSEPIIFNHALKLVAEVKEILLSLLQKDRVTTMHKRINEALDMELLQQQAENDALDIQKLSTFLIDTMASMCAPVRDKDVEALRSIDNITELFKGIYSVLKSMSRDTANFHIAAFRPHIQQQMVEQERSKFSLLLSKLPNGLDVTEKWLERVYMELKEEHTKNGKTSTPSSSTSDKRTDQNSLSPMTVLKHAYTKLLQWNHATEIFPETVAVDQARYYQLQQEYKRLLLVASVVLSTYASLDTQLSSQQSHITSLKKDLMLLLESEYTADNELTDTLSAIVELVWDKTCRYLKEIAQTTLPAEKKISLAAQIENLSCLNDNPIYNLLAKRANKYISDVVEYYSQHKSSISSLSPLPVPQGLQVVAMEMSVLAASYHRLVSLNQLVYGPFYASLLSKLLGLKSPAESQSATPGGAKESSNFKSLFNEDKAMNHSNLTGKDLSSSESQDNSS